ncbi:MAG TPA: hypothetical protein VFR91_09115 [Dyella sp.]|nr:hypothetical protein [Dyella sp.]
MHRYQGKESGLMVIGSQSELRALGAALLAAAEHPPSPQVGHWPPEVAEVAMSGSHRFLLSFHLEVPGASTPKSNFP